MWEGYCDGAIGANAGACTGAGGTWVNPQHAELNPVVLGRYHKLQGVFENYAAYTDSITETMEFEENEDGTRSMSHSVDVEGREGDATDPNLAGLADKSAKGIAQAVAFELFDTLLLANTFGINVFTNAALDLKDPLRTFSNSRFTESYDLKSNKFSFTRKERLLSDGLTSPNNYTIDAKYSLQINEDGSVQVVEDLNILSRTNDITSIIADLPIIKADSFPNCQSVFLDWDTGLVFNINPEPTSIKTGYDWGGHSVTLSTTFSNSPQTAGSTIEESITVERNEKGIGTLDYNVNFRTLIPKQKDIDLEDITGTPSTIIHKLNTYDTLTPEELVPVGGGAVWTSYWFNEAATSPLFFQNHTALFRRHAEGGFWVYHPAPATFTPSPTQWTLLNKTTNMGKLGKDFSLKKKFTDDPVHVKSLPGCTNCFKKVESKISDSWPKNTFSEHPVVNRGVGPDGNSPKSSVLSYGYNSQPGKRTVNLTAIIPRKKWNILHYSNSNVDQPGGPYVPIEELKALAKEARRQLLSAFSHPRISKGYQYVGYLSALSYVFDSTNNVTLTAEMTYGYKMIPHGLVGHPKMNYNP